MPTASQIKAARALANIGASDLARAIGISTKAMSNIELEISRPREETTQKIIDVFTARGIEFTDHEGVRRRPEGLELFEGHTRFNEFTEYVYQHIMEVGGDVRILVSDERLFLKYRRDHETYRQRMKEYVDSGRGRVLILAEQSNFNSQFAIVKKSPIHTSAPTSYYAFGDCIALISFEHKNPPRVFMIKDTALADSYKKSFDALWSMTK